MIFFNREGVMAVSPRLNKLVSLMEGYCREEWRKSREDCQNCGEFVSRLLWEKACEKEAEIHGKDMRLACFYAGKLLADAAASHVCGKRMDISKLSGRNQFWADLNFLLSVFYAEHMPKGIKSRQDERELAKIFYEKTFLYDLKRPEIIWMLICFDQVADSARKMLEEDIAH